MKSCWFRPGITCRTLSVTTTSSLIWRSALLGAGGCASGKRLADRRLLRHGRERETEEKHPGAERTCGSRFINFHCWIRDNRITYSTRFGAVCCDGAIGITGEMLCCSQGAGVVGREEGVAAEQPVRVEAGLDLLHGFDGLRGCTSAAGAMPCACPGPCSAETVPPSETACSANSFSRPVAMEASSCVAGSMLTCR